MSRSQRLNILLFVFLLFPAVHLSAQSNITKRLFLDLAPDTFLIRSRTVVDTVQLPHPFLIPQSEKVYRNNFRLFGGIHYQMDDRRGFLKLKKSLNPGDSLLVIYKHYPFPIIPEYFHQEMQTVVQDSDSTTTGRVGKAMVGSRFMEEMDSFSSSLKRSGSIVRGVEIGSNRDLTLNSGLNLQLSGYITPQVQLVAALTDESTPLQPEGNTQTLREVDKVFVKIRSPHLGGTLGDFNLNYRNSAFANLQRKLQGISLDGGFRNYQQQLTYATSRGTFHTNQFLGQEGKQGPYQLVGKNGEREIIVLAGTEHIYVNGKEQIRGENNDFIIDYSLGQIRFTNKRLITSEDRIEVDFEYAASFQRYGKNFLGFSAARSISKSGLEYDLRLFREWDDTKNLLEDSSPLTDAEKTVLAAAGDDPLRAAVNGATQVESGKGNYVLETQGGQSYFRYIGSNQGDYTVRFSEVGTGNGDYVRERLGVYRWVGPGNGSYLPVRLVPLAADKKFGDLSLRYRHGQHFSITGEAAVTNHDLNVFSSTDDGDNTGQAFTVGAEFSNQETRLFGRRLGALNWKLKWDAQDEKFAPLDRQFRPEYTRRWNLATTDLLTRENKLESGLQYAPFRGINLLADGGWIRRGSQISSRRGSGRIVSADSSLLKANLFGELVISENPGWNSRWTRNGGELGRQLGPLMPYLQLSQEDRTVDTGDTVRTGFRFTEQSAGLKLARFLGMKWHFNSRLRKEQLYNPGQTGQRQDLSRSVTHRFQMSIAEQKQWQGRLSLVFRDKDYSPFFERLPADSMARYQPDPQFQDTSWQDRQSHLGNLELRYRSKNNSLDSRWNYQVASELEALQEKVFLKVEENRGNYRYDEILGEYVPDPLGDFLLIVVPTGNFESVTNVEASWQLRYRPPRAKKNPDGWRGILKNISTFTLLKLDEKSREQNVWQLYILNLKKYHNTRTTLRGRYTINQDIFLFERNPNFGFTLRSRYRDNLSNQYVDADFNETQRTWDRSIAWRQSLWKRKLSQELEYKQSFSFRSVAAAPSRNRDILTHAGSVKLIYRPVYAWQIRLVTEAGWQKDRAELNRMGVRFVEFRPQVNFSMKGKARALATLTALNVQITENPFNRPIPYEMGKGKKAGNSYLWNLRFEYFVSNHITVTVSYNGRRDAGAVRTIHLGQAEVRAFF